MTDLTELLRKRDAFQDLRRAGRSITQSASAVGVSFDTALQWDREPRMIDVPAAAQYLGVGIRMVRNLIADRRLPFYKVGTLVRLSTVDLDDFLAANRVEAAP